MTYEPNPMDLTAVELSENLLTLTECMAKNTHEVWAANRAREGWTYGNFRDDVLKTHPCLVPYEELTEQEKEYDRNTALQTIKMIIKLGYNIVPR